MFEGVLFFALGFLAAALIVLMISPVIWNRAVTLTKRRIESSVPLTLNEIQADKDQLRAEFAMSTRRLELSIEELREKASRQMIDINRKRDDLAKLSQESREKIRMMEELESRSADLRAKLNDREEALEKTSRRLAEAKAELERRALEMEQLNRRFAEAQSESDSRRIELVTSQTSLESVEARMEELLETNRSLQNRISELESGRDTAESRASDLDSRFLRLQKMNAELEQKVQSSEREIAELRNTRQTNEDTSDELTGLLMRERKRTTELESKLASTTLRIEALLNDASNENVKRAMAELKSEKDDLKGRLRQLEKERDALAKETASYRGASQAEWETERKENAFLRERINDLAAQVTAMTASLEGAASPINSILDAAEKETDSRPGKDRGSKQAIQEAVSLADRIRALQDSARLKKA